MPLAQKLTKKKAKKKLPIQGPDINRKGHNTAVAGGSGKAGTLITPKIDVTKITKDKEFQEQLYSLIDDIEITEDDVPDEMLEDWYDLQDELKPVLIEKNWLLWATLFSAVVLPGIVQGTRSEPTVKQPAVIIKGKQQEPIPPLEPRQIVNYSQEYFKEHGLELCKSLTETDLTRLKGDLVQNWNKGEDAFAKAFKESYPVSKQRLELIYRSERHMAEYHGVMKRAERAGHTRKMWRAVGDERTCSECMDYDLEIVPIDEPFSNGMMTANAHPGCRCSMVTLTDEEYDEMPDEQFSDEQLPDYGEEWDEETKQDAAYLNDAFDFIKLNYNCPDSEKSGSGPGSCGGNTKSESNNSSNKKISIINPSESQLIIKGTRLPTDTEKNIVSEISKTIPPEMMKWAGDLDIRNSGLEVVVTSPEYEASPNHGWTSHAMVNRIFLQDNVFKSTDKIKAMGEGTIKHELIHALVGSKIDSYIPGGGRSVLAKEGIRMPIHAYDSDHNGGSIDEFYTMVMENYRGNGEFNDEELSKIEVEKELGKGKWGDYLHSDRWTPAEIEKVKSVVLKWTNDENMLNTFLSKERKLKQWEDEDAALQNSAYLNDAVDFIKMNYNCPDSEKTGSGPGSCGGKESSPEEPRWKTSAYIMNSIDAQLDIHLPNKTAALIMQQGTKFNPNMREELNYKGSGIGLTKRIGGIPNVWYNKVEHEQYADNEGIYSEALHEIGHSLTYPYGDDLKKLDIWKDNSPKSLHEDLKKAGIENMKGLIINMSDEDEAFADLFKSYINPRTNLKLKAAAPEVYAKMETMFGKSDYDIDLPEPAMKLFKTLAHKSWNLKSSDFKELGITEKQFEEITDLIEPPHAKGQTFIASTEWGSYPRRMQTIKEMFVKPSDTLILRRNSEKVMRETNKNLMTKGISSDEKKSLFSLKTDLYGDVGSYLTGGNSRFNDPTYVEQNQEYFNYIKDTIQKVDSVLDKSELSGDITTYRYVRSRYADILKQNIGKQILNKNYIYTTLTENIAKEAAAGKGAYLTMEVPKGIKGIDMDSFTTGDMLENEVMLERNLIMNIKEHKVLDNGMDWFKVSIEKPSQKHNQLSEVADFLQKLNYNCKDEEKSGSGPGSCSHGITKKDDPKVKLTSLEKQLTDINSQILKTYDTIRDYDKSKYTWEEWIKTSEFNEESTRQKDLYKKQHEIEVEKAILTFVPPKGPQRQKFENLVNISESAIKSIPDGEKGISYYIAGSTDITHELLRRPDMPREILPEEKIEEFKKQNDLDGTRWHGPTHNAIARLDKIMAGSKLQEDITLYTGISKNFWDSLPKDLGSEFENLTFISTTIDPKIAKGFAALRKKQHNEGYGKQKMAYYIEIVAKAGTSGIATEKAAIRQNPLGTWIVGEGGKQGGGGSQQEIILNRKQRYRIVGGIESDGKTFQKIRVETI